MISSRPGGSIFCLTAIHCAARCATCIVIYMSSQEKLRAQILKTLSQRNDTQQTLADSMGLSKYAMHRRLTGKTLFLNSEFEELADYLRVDVRFVEELA